MSRLNFRLRFVPLGLIAAALFSAMNAAAATYTYTPTNPTGDLWSAGTDWTGSTAPVSASTTELTFVDASGSTALTGGQTNTNTDDISGLFQLNILDLGGQGAASGGAATININSTSPSTGLNFISNGATAPVVNLAALAGTVGLTYNLNAPITLSNNITFQGNGTATFNVTGAISGSGATLTKSGSSALTLTGNNMYSGGTTLNAGLLFLGGASGAALGTGDLTLNNTGGFTEGVYLNTDQATGVIHFKTSANFSNYVRTNGHNWTTAGLDSSTSAGHGVVENGGANKNVTATGTLTLNVPSASSFTFDGVMRNADAGGGTGLLALVKNGLGTQTLAGASISYTGGTTVNAGTLKMDLTGRTANPSLGTIATGASGTLELFNTSTTVDGTTGLITGTTFSGSGTINKTGAGYIDLWNGGGGSTIGTFTGTINVQAGTLASQVSWANTSGVTLNIASGATFDDRNHAVVFDKLTGSGTFTTSFNGGNSLTVGAQGGSSTFSGAIQNVSAALPVTKSGAGTFTLAGADTYTGGTTVSGGTLQFAKLVADPASGAVAVQTGATLAVNLGGTGEWTTGASGAGTVGGLLAGLGGQTGGTVTYAGNVNLGFDTTNNGGTSTYSSAIGNVGTTLGITKLGANSLTLSGANTYTGGTTINAGTLVEDMTTRTGYGQNLYTFVVNASGTLTLLNTGTTVDATGFTSGSISGSGTLNKTGAGYLDFAGSSIKNFTGAINVNAGTLASNNSDWGSAAGAINLAVASGANFDLRVGNVVINNLTGSGTIGTTYVQSPVLSVGNNNGSSQFDGVIQNPLSLPGAQAGGTVGLTKNGTGTLTLTGVNAYTGATVINAGTLQIGSSVNASGGSISGSSAVTIGASGTLTFASNGAAIAIANTFSGTGALNFTGPNAVLQGYYAVSANNSSYTGTLTVNGARINDANNANNFGGAAIVVQSSGQVLASTSGATYTNNITLNGNGWQDSGPILAGALRMSNNTWAGNITLGSDSRISAWQNDTASITGNITGAHQLEMGGGGTGTSAGTITLTPNSANNFSSLLLSSGTIKAGNATAFAAGTGLTANSGTLTLNGNSFSFANLAGTGGVIQNNSSSAASTLTIGSDGTSTAFSGALNDGSTRALSLFKTGGGTLSLSGTASSYSGGTTISGGTIRITADAASGNATLGVVPVAATPNSIILNGGALSAGATLGLNANRGIGLGPTIGGTGGTGALDVANSGQTLTYNGIIASAGNAGTNTLNKTGLGILTLGGNSTDTGAVNVNGGTLNLTGSLASTTATVASGATLSGTGTMTSAALSVNGGGTIALASGNPVNSLSVGSLTLGSAGTYGSSTYATLNYTAGATGVQYLNDLGSLTSTNVFVNVSGFLPDGTYPLLNLGSLTTLNNFSLSSSTANVSSINAGRQVYTINDGATASALSLVVTGVANPAVAYWNGAVSTTWSDTSNPSLVNWSTNLAGTTDAGNFPGANTDVILNSSLQTGTVATTLGANLEINSLNVNGNGTNTIASGNTLTILALADSNTSSDPDYTGNPAGQGILIGAAANAFTINAAVTVGGSQTWTNGSANTFTIGGAVNGSATSGSQTLTLKNSGAGNTLISGAIGDGSGGGKLALVVNNSGAGLTTLSGTNTYTGGTTITAGTLSFANGSLGPSGSITMNGGTLQWNGTNTQDISSRLVMVNATNATFDTNGNTVTFASAIGSSTTASLTKIGAGTVTLSAAYTYTGGSTVTGGTLKLDLTSRNANPVGLGAISVGANGTLELFDTNTTIDVAGTELGNSTTFIGSGIINKTGAGYLDFYSAGGATSIKNFAGTINVQAGTLASNGSDWPSSAGSMNLSVASGANFDLRTGNVVINSLNGSGTIGTTFTQAPVLSVGNNNGSSQFDGVILNGLVLPGSQAGGVVGLTKNGSGTLTLTGANSYTGATTISGGTLRIGAGGATGSLSTSGSITDNANLTFNRSDAITQGAQFNGSAITGTGSVSQISGGTTTLTAANTYTGGTTINAGVLRVGTVADTGSSNIGLSSGATNNILTLGGGTLQYTGAGVATTGRNVALTANSTIVVSGGAVATLTLGGTVSGSGFGLNLGAGSSGILTLSNTNTYTGATNVNAGTLNLTGSLASTTATVASGAALTGTGSMNSAALTVNGGATVNLASGNPANSLSVGSLTLGSSGTYGAATYVTLNFTATPSGVESLNDLGGLTANNVFVNIAGSSLANGSYPLLTLPSAALNNFSLSGSTANVASINIGRQVYSINNGTTASSLLLTVSGTANPGVAYWNGAVSTTWNDVTNPTVVNWSTDLAGATDAGNIPGSNTDVILNASSQAGTVATTLGANLTINSLNVNGNGTNTVAAGNTLTINAAADSNTASDSSYTGNAAGQGILIASAANAFTLNAAVTLGGSQKWTNGSANTFTVGGAVNGSAAALSSQTLTLQNTGAGVTAITGAIGDGTNGGALALTVNNSGAGVTTLSAVNTYTGVTTITAGTLRISGAGQLNSGNYAGNISNAGTLQYNSSAAQVLSGVISGGGALAMSGSNTLTLSGTNSFTGGTTINSGTLKEDLSGRSGANQTLGTITFGASGTLELFNTNAAIDGSTSLVGGTTINGSGTINKTGAGYVDLWNSGNNSSIGTFAGTINVQAGTLASQVNWSNSAGAITLNIASGATFDDRAFAVVVDQLTGSGTVTTSNSNANSLVVGAQNGSSSFSGVIQNGTAVLPLTKNGNGTLTLTGANTYTGATTVNGGVLEIVNGTTFASPVTVNSGGDFRVTNNTTTTAFAQLGGTAAIVVKAGGILELNNTSTGYPNRKAFAAPVSGAGTLNVVGAGYMALNSSNNITLTGQINVQSGGLGNDSGTTSAFGTTTAALSISSGAYFDLRGGASQFDALTGAGAVIDSNAAATLTVGVAGGSGTFSGIIQSGGNAVTGGGSLATSLIKAGSGTQILSGANTYTGTTTISGGTLQIGDSGATGNLGTATVTDNAALVFNRNDSPGLTVGAAINGTGTVTQNGVGITTLSATNGYMGATTINAGTLAVNGSLSNASTVTVNDTGTLAGIGTVGGSVILAGGTTGGTLRSTTALTIGGTLTVNGLNNTLASGTVNTTGDTINGTLTVNGTLGGTGFTALTSGATLAGIGAVNKQVTLAGNNTLSSTGSLTLGSTLTINGTGNVIPSGSTINVASLTTISGGGSLTVNGTLGGAGTTTVNGTLSGAGTVSQVVTVNSMGTVAPGQTNNVPTMTASTLKLGSGSSLSGSALLDLIAGTGSTDQIAFANGAAASATLGGTLTVTNPNAIAFAAGQSYDLFNFNSNTESGTFSTVNLPSLGTSTLIWNTANLYSTGVISIVTAGPPLGSGTWTNGAGGRTWTNANNWMTGQPSGATYVATFDATGYAATSPNPVLLGTAGQIVGGLTFNTSTATGYTIGGGGSDGSLTLNNNGSSAATITVNGGDQIIAANVVVAETTGATLSAVSGASLSITGTVNNGGYAVTVSGAGNTTLSGALSGSGSLTMSGSGTLTLGHTNSGYSGLTTVSSGTLRTTANVDNALGTGALVANAPVSLGGNESIGTLIGSGSVSVAASKTLTVTQAADASLNGSLTLGTTSAGGTLALSATNTNKLTLTGSTTLGTGNALAVNGGTLNFNLGNTSTPSVGANVTAMVANGATLELTGTISALADPTALSSGTDTHLTQRVAIQNEGALEVDGGTTMTQAAQQVGGIDGAGSVTVADYSSLTADHINQTSLVIGNGSVFTLAPSDMNGNPMTSLGANNSLVLAGSLSPSTGFVASRGSLLAAGGASSTPSVSLGGALSGASLNAVPEPSTIMLALFGCIAAFPMLRRLRRTPMRRGPDCI